MVVAAERGCRESGFGGFNGGAGDIVEPNCEAQS